MKDVEVFTGSYNDTVDFHPDEIKKIQWISIKELNKRIKNSPDEFTFWFIKAFKKWKEYT